MPDDLRQLRKKANLTQAELAARSGIRQATISALENGHTDAQIRTIQALAIALGSTPDEISETLKPHPVVADPITQIANSDWPFLSNLDQDLRHGLATALVATWTHSSTALEGNTINAGDTLFVLTEGLTISGKSLREHQEIHGHAQALSLIESWVSTSKPIRIEHLHQLHRAVMAGAPLDSQSPLGSWKTEPNGTNAITSKGKTGWHDYASPKHVPALIEMFLKSLARVRRSKNPNALTESFTEIHLAFTAIHPYADGNGRIARLLANLPLLQAGYPPLLINSSKRREYITLIGDFSLQQGTPHPGDDTLVQTDNQRASLHDFFAAEWQPTLDLVAEFHQRQEKR